MRRDSDAVTKPPEGHFLFSNSWQGHKYISGVRIRPQLIFWFSGEAEHLSFRKKVWNLIRESRSQQGPSVRTSVSEEFGRRYVWGGLEVIFYVKHCPLGTVERRREWGSPWPGPPSSILRIGQSIMRGVKDASVRGWVFINVKGRKAIKSI